jgi:hypothetical protein
MTLPAPDVRLTVVNDADAVSETNQVPGTASQAGSKRQIVVLQSRRRVPLNNLTGAFKVNERFNPGEAIACRRGSSSALCV